jgi:hypothetical protein
MGAKMDKRRKRAKNNMNISNPRVTLAEGEPHPVAFNAGEYLAKVGVEKLIRYLEAYSSCAIEGNRLGEICAETLNRLLTGQPVSDRYILGLAWNIKEMEEKDLRDKIKHLLVRENSKDTSKKTLEHNMDLANKIHKLITGIK